MQMGVVPKSRYRDAACAFCHTGLQRFGRRFVSPSWSNDPSQFDRGWVLTDMGLMLPLGGMEGSDRLRPSAHHPTLAAQALRLQLMLARCSARRPPKNPTRRAGGDSFTKTRPGIIGLTTWLARSGCLAGARNSKRISLVASTGVRTVLAERQPDPTVCHASGSGLVPVVPSTPDAPHMAFQVIPRPTARVEHAGKVHQ